jgi:hypothetical protein
MKPSYMAREQQRVQANALRRTSKQQAAIYTVTRATCAKNCMSVSLRIYIYIYISNGYRIFIYLDQLRIVWYASTSSVAHHLEVLALHMQNCASTPIGEQVSSGAYLDRRRTELS